MLLRLGLQTKATFQVDFCQARLPGLQKTCLAYSRHHSGLLMDLHSITNKACLGVVLLFSNLVCAVLVQLRFVADEQQGSACYFCK